MKKILLMAGVLLATVGFATHASASEALTTSPSVYVGADYQITKFDNVGSGEDVFDSVNGHIGVNLNEVFAVEFGIADSFDETTTGANTDIRSYTVDTIAALPVTQKVDVLGTAGLSYNQVDRGTASDENVFGWQLGTGAQYHVTENLSFRGLVKYDGTDYDSIDSEDAIKTTIGFNYGF